jgi:hypothetical protein
LPKQALLHKPMGRRDVGHPRKRWTADVWTEDSPIPWSDGDDDDEKHTLMTTLTIMSFWMIKTSASSFYTILSKLFVEKYFFHVSPKNPCILDARIIQWCLWLLAVCYRVIHFRRTCFQTQLPPHQLSQLVTG